MKHRLLYLLVFILAANLAFAQKSYIVINGMSPTQLTKQAMTTNSVSQGLKVIPKGTYAYFSVKGVDTAGHTEKAVTSVIYNLITAPTGSAASLISYGTNSVMFLADSSGKYQITATITTAVGVNTDTATLYASTYLGVGNFDGVAGTGLRCMACHTNAQGTTASMSAIFSKWSSSMHAVSFKNKITDSTQTHFGANCYKCHTTGSDHNIVVNNNGFDDIASKLGWTIGTPNSLKWDTLKSQYSGLVNMATIGCESCHGAGSSHSTTSGDRKGSIQITLSDATCDKCHDSAPRYPEPDAFRNSMHASTVWSSSFAKNITTTTYSLDNCIRCHDGNGFVAFTKGVAKDFSAYKLKDHTGITCATCHDQHGNGNLHQLRTPPTGSDTLGNGVSYNGLGGTGNICMNCHKARKNNVTMLNTTVSSTWGPHHTSQTDELLGENAAIMYGDSAYANGMHKDVLADACVTCHMSATVDTSDHANYNTVGGHSWHMRNETTNYQNVKVCQGCHTIDSFDTFLAGSDYDGNGKIEPVQTEVKGLLKQVALLLPHTGPDTALVINWSAIKASSDSIRLKKAWWNYQLVVNDGSYGIHNMAFTVDVLQRTIKALGGTVDVRKDASFAPTKYSLEQNYPNPFNPSTTIKFSVPQAGMVKVKIYDASGNLIRELFNQYVQQGSFNIVWNGADSRGNKVASGIYIYKMESQNYTMSKKMVLMK
jgi:hypothetical protein